MPPKEWCSFSLDPDELAELRRRVAAESMTMPPWFYLAMTFVFGAQLGIVVVRHRDSLATVVYGLIFTAWVISVICVTIARRRRIPASGSLDVSSAGFRGTLDGSPATIRWWDIARVHDLDDAIVVFRRRSRSPVVIPKAGIGDVSAFWSLLEEQLVSKRNLIAPAVAPKQILNTTY